MKDLFKSMLEHPIATWFVVSVTSSALATVIGSCKKVVNINVVSEKTGSN